MIEKDRGLKIGDLGISKQVSRMTKSTVNFPGTANYMSPEVIMEDPSYTNKIDVWAVGCVVYELITLKRLFDEKIDIMIKNKVLIADIVLPDCESTLRQVLEG